MAINLFVGNLPFSVDDTQLKDMFLQAGSVVSASVIKDKYSGKSRGFGFVEMDTEQSAAHAIELLNGTSVEGRPLVVNMARTPKQA